MSALSLALVMATSLTSASTTATAVVTYTINSIDPITVSGDPGPLIINSAVAGSGPSSAVDSSTTYAITTNNSGETIMGYIGSNMPSGVALTVNLAAPTGATSVGNVTLTTVPQNLVTGIATVAEGGLVITYTLTATASAALVSGATATVTYTVGP